MKKWKLLETLGIVLILVGTVQCGTSVISDELSGGTALILGLVAYIGGRFGGWWRE